MLVDRGDVIHGFGMGRGVRSRTWIGAGLSVALGLCATAGCRGEAVEGSGLMKERTLDAEGFTRLSVCCGFGVHLTLGDEEGIQVEGDSNIVDHVVARREGSLLQVKYDDDFVQYDPSEPVQVNVTMRDVEDIALYGGADFTADSLSTFELKLAASEGSAFHISELNAEQLEVQLSSSSRLEVLDGSMDSQNARLSSGSDYLVNAETPDVELHLRGGSQAMVRASETLNIEASDGSRVEFYGDPTVSEDLSGGSETVQLEVQP